MAKSKDSGKLKYSGNDVFDLKKFVSHYPSNIAILKQINQAIESFSEYDKMNAAGDLRYLIQEAKSKGFLAKGRIKDLVGEYMNLGPTQAQKYLTVYDKGSDAIKEALKNKEITLTEAVKRIKQALKSSTKNTDTEDIPEPGGQSVSNANSQENQISDTKILVSAEIKSELESKWAELTTIIKNTESPYIIRIFYTMQGYFKKIMEV